MNNGPHNGYDNGYNQPNYNNGYNGNYGNNGYNGYNGNYNNNSPQNNNSNKTLIFGIVTGVLLCGIIVLIILLVNRSGSDAVTQKVDTVKVVEVKEVREIEQLSPNSSQASTVYDSGPLHSGYNVLNGTFNFNGSSFGFTLSFNYDPATGRASGGKYSPQGYSGTTNVSVSVSDGGNSITATSKNTNINVSSSGGGIYSGWMQRGNHSGSCSLSVY